MRRFSPCFKRTGCSTPDPPHLSVSTRSFSLRTHVGSPGISSLHSAEPTFSATEPHRCHIEFQKAAAKPNPRLLGCNPLQHDHTSAPRSEAVYTSDASTQHISGSGISHEVPGTGTLLRTLGRRTCINRTELQNTASSVLLAFACCFLLCSLANGAAAQGQIDSPTPRLLTARICLFVCYEPLYARLAPGTCVAFVNVLLCRSVRCVFFT